MLIVQGLVFAVIYYFLFLFLIRVFDLKTPGREDEELVAETGQGREGIKENRFEVMAAQIYEGLGGDDNVVSVDYCTSRLRVEVKDMNKVDEAKIKATGVPGTNIVGKHNIQVIVGTNVQFVADEINKIRS